MYINIAQIIFKRNSAETPLKMEENRQDNNWFHRSCTFNSVEEDSNNNGNEIHPTQYIQEEEVIRSPLKKNPHNDIPIDTQLHNCSVTDEDQVVKALPPYEPQHHLFQSAWDIQYSLIKYTKINSKKYDLLKEINKIDAEIKKTESTLLQLKKREQEIMTSYDGLKNNNKEDQLVQKPEYCSLAQKIYTENMIKVRKNQFEMEKLGGFKLDNSSLHFVYSNIPVYHGNEKKYSLFKNRLQDYLRNKIKEKKLREENQSRTYLRQMEEWQREIDIILNSEERKKADLKYRKIFEQEFPHLKKTVVDKERELRALNRSSEIKSRKAFMQQCQAQDLQKLIKAHAQIPPLFDADQRKYDFVNNNGKILDFATEYNNCESLHFWTEEEIKIFKEKFKERPKDFHFISSFLKDKTVPECVKYYYLTKKDENYKLYRRPKRQIKENDNKVKSQKKEVADQTNTGELNCEDDSYDTNVSDNPAPTSGEECPFDTYKPTMLSNIGDGEAKVIDKDSVDCLIFPSCSSQNVAMCFEKSLGRPDRYGVPLKDPKYEDISDYEDDTADIDINDFKSSIMKVTHSTGFVPRYFDQIVDEKTQRNKPSVIEEEEETDCDCEG